MAAAALGENPRGFFKPISFMFYQIMEDDVNAVTDADENHRMLIV